MLRCLILSTVFVLQLGVGHANDDGFSKSTARAGVSTRGFSPSTPENTAIRYGGFVRLAQRLQPIRKDRRVPIETFLEMSKDPQTIIFDSRSKDAFDLVHMSGAVHLNFSDFSDEKLRKHIHSKDTRILIYCNNNFKPKRASRISDTNGDGTIDANDRQEVDQDVLEGFTPKSPSLALNIPTFINLYGYGYENVFELADQLELDDPRLKLAGSAIDDESGLSDQCSD